MEQFETIDEYLVYVGRNRRSGYGRMFRSQFRDTRGTAELAMLAAPSEAEYADFSGAVAAMSEEEKANIEMLDEQAIESICERADVDCGNVNIFVNGYVLARRKGRDQTL